MMKSLYIQVQTTLPSESDALSLSRALVEMRLAACVQIVSCYSMYHWQKKIEEEGEYLCIMKTRENLFQKLCKAIEKLHPYDVPEIIALPVVAGGQPYLDWLEQELL